MKTRTKAIAGTILFALLSIPSARADLFDVADVNGDPNTFECDITAVQKDVTIGGVTVHAMAYQDDNSPVPPTSAGMPIQVIKVKVGDMVICRFKNELTSESASIHWHGIELDNDSDGTPVTQDAVLPGQSYTYRFKTFRPGIFWFHSHMLPGNTLFGGIYGVLIIENNIESNLIATGTIPAASDTYNIAMSDVEFDASGNIGKNYMGATKTENELIELCHLGALGEPGGDHGACTVSAAAGSTVLVNGQKPDSGAQTPMFTVPSGKRIRLRLLNESISRHFRVSLMNNGDNKIYRIGGQGGLLDNIVLDGGIKGTWDTKFNSGEIQLGSGMRADVIIFPTGADGTIIQLVGNPTAAPFNISTALPANYPIAYFKISGSASDPAPSAGDPILEGTAEDIENIKTLTTVVPLIDPAPNGGSSDETIRLQTGTPTGPGTFVDKLPTVDGYVAALDSNAGNSDWLTLARPPTARYAYVGDLLELTVRNESAGQGAHPYHLHGFSMQPVRIVDNTSGNTLYDWDYDEFIDTIDVIGGQSYVFRVRLDDRAKFCDLSPDYPMPNPGPVLATCASDTPCGGAVGRWLFHCHIVNHGALGMIGELTVLQKPLQIVCPTDIVQANDPGQCSAVVNFAPVTSGGCGAVSVVCTPPSGSAFPVGTTTVTCKATDGEGGTAQCTFKVTVNDTEKPKITSSSLAVSTFWSPSHELINVGLKATATDNCGAVTLSVAVYGDEDDEAPTGDGTFSPDAKNIGLTTLRLRTERNQKGDGRVYLIVVTATDTAGNKSTSALTVVVPKDQTTKSFDAVMAQATAARNYFIANNAPPPGYFVIGDGPVIGSKQ